MTDELKEMLQRATWGLRDLVLLQLHVLGGPAELTNGYEVSLRANRLRALLREIAANEVANARDLPDTVRDERGNPMSVDWTRTTRFLFGLDGEHHPQPGHLTERQSSLARDFGIYGEWNFQTFQRKYRDPLLLKVIAAALVRREEDGWAAQQKLGEPAEDPQPETASEGVEDGTPAVPPVLASVEPQSRESDEEAALHSVGVSAPRRVSRRRLLIVAGVAGALALVLVLANVSRHPHSAHRAQLRSSSTPTQTSTASTAPTTTAPAAPTPRSTPPKPTQPQPVGLAQIANSHGLSWGLGGQPTTYTDSGGNTVGTGGDVATVSIGGEVRANAISGRLWYYGGGFSSAVIETRHRYRLLDGIVGIDDNTECPKNTARVHVEDERGNVLWGPRTAQVGRVMRFKVDMRKTTKVSLVNELSRSSAVGGDQCEHGDADPAWGSIALLPRR